VLLPRKARIGAPGVLHHIIGSGIERARGFLEAARLSNDWVRDMGNQALIKADSWETSFRLGVCA